MEVKKDVQMGNPGYVIPGCNSQTANRVGIHWQRYSFDYKDIGDVAAFVSEFYGDYGQDEFCTLNYTTRFIWSNGVSLNYDADSERRERLHRDRITLDVPGSACDELTCPDLLLFFDGCRELGGKSTRLDVFFDDYERPYTMDELRGAAAEGDFSMFNVTSENRTRNRTRKENDGIVYDAVTFGRRASKGSGSFLRVYDKNLESNGESNSIRWELELTQHKADKVFKYLAGCDGNLETFASVCGAVIGGCITFVHRTQRAGDKNIIRLAEYDWWVAIKETLRTLSLRIAKKTNTLTGTIEWVERQISPSLALVRKAFRSWQDFYNFMCHLLEVGESRMNYKQRQIAKQHGGSLVYDRKYNREKQESDYLR
ncbi:hypothetical protein ES705_29793 [subsurface metagenome]